MYPGICDFLSVAFPEELELLLYTNKKENKIFLIYKENKRDRVQSHMRQRTSHICGKICAFPHILGSPSSYMTLQLLHSEFPYI